MAITKVSDTVADFCWEGIFQHQQQPTDGPLQFTVTGGNTSDNKNWFVVPQVTVDLVDDAVNRVALYYETGDIDITTNRSSLNYTLLYNVTTAGGVITNIEDVRTHYKERKLTVTTPTGFPLDDFTATTANIGGAYVWLYPTETSLSDGWINDVGSSFHPAKIYGNTSNLEIVAGPGAPSLTGVKFKRRTGTGNTDLESISFQHEVAREVATGNAGSEDDAEYGGISFFVYIDEATLPANPVYLTSMNNDSGTQSARHYIRVNSDGSVLGRFSTSDTGRVDTVSNVGAISPRTWHHIFFSRVRNGQMLVYIDGVEDTDLVASGALRDYWWLQQTVTSRASDCFDFGGAFYGYNGTNVVVNRQGVAHDADFILAGMQLWWGQESINATTIAALNSTGRG